MSNTNSLGFLNVTQGVVDNATQLHKVYDLIISAIGWEARTTHALIKVAGRSENNIAFRFHSEDETFVRRKDLTQAATLNILGSDTRIVSLLESKDFHENCSMIRDLLSQERVRIGKPLRVAFDITSIPKRYMLFILGLGFKAGLFASLDILYSEGQYEKVESTGHLPNTSWISRGEWTSIQVPFFESDIYAPTERELFISLGAEITPAIPVIEKFEPDYLKIYRVADSSSRFPDALLSDQAVSIETIRAMPSAVFAEYNLSDVIGIAKDILSEKRKNLSCLALGAKPHAVGMAIAALASDDIELLCRSPQGYRLHDVKARGPVFWFRLEDRFEPAVC